MRDREFPHVEPQRPLDFAVRIVALEIDAGQLDIELRLRFRQILGKEHDIRFPLAKAALEIDAHLLGHEADLALVGHHAFATGGGDGRYQRHASRAQVSSNTVEPMLLCHRYHCSLRGEIGSGSIDSPNSRLTTTSTAVSQCSAIAPPL